MVLVSGSINSQTVFCSSSHCSCPSCCCCCCCQGHIAKHFPYLNHCPTRLASHWQLRTNALSKTPEQASIPDFTGTSMEEPIDTFCAAVEGSIEMVQAASHASNRRPHPFRPSRPSRPSRHFRPSCPSPFPPFPHLILQYYSLQ